MYYTYLRLEMEDEPVATAARGAGSAPGGVAISDDPAVPDPVPEDSVLCWAVAAVIITALTWVMLVWAIIGLYVGYDANFSPFTTGQCGTGCTLIWYCVILGLLQMRCCHVWSVNDAQSEPEPHSEDDVESPQALPQAATLGPAQVAEEGSLAADGAAARAGDASEDSAFSVGIVQE